MTARPTFASSRWGHDEACDLAAVAYERFADVVDQLDADDWSAPTDCEGWSVRDLVGHVVGAMRSAASTTELFSQQREVGRRARRTGADRTDLLTAVQVERTAAASPGELAAECRALVAPAAAGRQRTPAPLRRAVRLPVAFDGGSERWTLGYLVDVILTRDAWLHRVDLCRAVGADPLLTADHDGRIVADAAEEWRDRHHVALHLRLTGPAGSDIGDPEHPSAALDAVEFCRALSGRSIDHLRGVDASVRTTLAATPVPF